MTAYRPIALDDLPEPIGIAEQPSPMLQWVEIAQMVVDDQYQRPITKRGWAIINQIARNFRWACFTPVLLAPIEGGRFAIIDGQHRVHAATICGVKSVPAMVVPIAATEQAQAFLQVNTQRQGMSQFSLYKAGLASGEPWAKACESAVADAGCRLMSFHPSAKNKKPGEIYAVGMVRQMVERGHADAVTRTLQAIRLIDTGGNASVLLYTEWLLKPLMTAVARSPRIGADALADILRKKRPFITIDAAERLAKAERRPVATIAAEMFALQIGAHLESEGME